MPLACDEVQVKPVCISSSWSHTDNSFKMKKVRFFQSLDLRSLIADIFSELGRCSADLGGIKYVSRLFLTCIKTMTTGHVTSMRDFF